MTLYPALAAVAVVALAVGAWFLRDEDPSLGRVWVVLFGIPFVVACLIGLRVHFLLPRTLAFGAWAAPLALAAVVERARRASIPLGLAAAALVAVLVAGSIAPAMRYQEGSTGARETLASQIRPGDAVAVHPSWLWPLAAWDLGAPRTSAALPGSLQGLDAFVFVVGGPGGDDGGAAAAFDGRVWVVQPNTYALDTGALVPCGTAYPVEGDYVLSCYESPGDQPLLGG